MKGIAACTCVLAIFVASAVAQDESESTTMKMTTSNGADLLDTNWYMDDATILPTGSLDLRMTFGWETGEDLRNSSSDNFTYSGGVLWGMANNLEGFLYTDWVIGDGDVDGNGDLNTGLNWRFRESDGTWPAMSLKASARIPTGSNSSGVDAEGRLILTNEYSSGIRSHANVFVATINGHNYDDWGRNDFFGDNGGWGLRDVNYGAVIGLDGPLCDNGAVRWVADYMWRAGRRNGSTNYNGLELGWEWMMEATSKLGMSVQISLDTAADEPDFGAKLTYSHALTF